MRVKCAGRGCEHARSTHDENGECRLCPTLPVTGRKGYCRGWSESRPHLWREYVSTTYRDWRDSWVVLFDLEANKTYRPGIIARERRLERRGGRREVTDFLEENPAPTFRAVLEGQAGTWTDEESAA